MIWHVKARYGDRDSPVRAWAKDDPVAMVERLLNTGDDGWKNLTSAPEPSAPPPAGGTKTSTAHASFGTQSPPAEGGRTNRHV